MAENPVLYVYKGVNIRRYNKVQLTFGEVQFKKIIDEADGSDLSIHKVLAYSGKPCDRCRDTSVFVYDKEGNEKKVKRGILHVPEGNGIGIIQKAKNKECKKQ